MHLLIDVVIKLLTREYYYINIIKTITISFTIIK